MSPKDKQALVASVPLWFHAIDVGDGLVTPGVKTPEILSREWASLHLPELTGKSVLDINGWDGYFAFQCETRGASAVTVLDYYVWQFDLIKLQDHVKRCRDGVPFRPETDPACYQPNALPGKRGFDVAKQLRNSQVREVVGNFMEIPLDTLGTFDIVLFLGTLYHMQDPLHSLRRLRAVTQDLAVIETDAVMLEGLENRAVCEFFEGIERNDDPTNWWAPNLQALIGMCRAAGFRQVDVQVGPPPAATARANWPQRLIHRLRSGGAVAPVRYRAYVHARV